MELSINVITVIHILKVVRAEREAKLVGLISLTKFLLKNLGKVINWRI